MNLFVVMRIIAIILLVVSPVVALAQSTNGISRVLTNDSFDQTEPVQLDLANGFFLREFYDLALAEYQKYLVWFPDGTAIEEVMYRIAECHRGPCSSPYV